MTLKIAVFAPMPSASVRTAMKVKPGDLRSWRKAKRKSFIISLGNFHSYRSATMGSNPIPLSAAKLKAPFCPSW